MFIHTLPSELMSDSSDLLSLLSWEMMEYSPLFIVLQGRRDRETEKQRDRGGLAADPHSSQYKPLCASVFAWGGLCLLKNAGHTINVRLKLTHTHKSGHRVNNCS